MISEPFFLSKTHVYWGSRPPSLQWHGQVSEALLRDGFGPNFKIPGVICLVWYNQTKKKIGWL